MDMILKELEGDVKDAEYEEKTAQKDYEELMADSKESRSEKLKSITNKEAAKAEVGAKKEANTEKERGDVEDVLHIHKYVARASRTRRRRRRRSAPRRRRTR